MKSLRLAFFGVCLSAWMTLCSSSLWAQQSWAFEAVTPAIYSLDEPIVQRFNLADTGQVVLPNQSLNQIMVQILPSAAAFIESYLCVNDTSHCVSIQGGRIYTQAFSQYSANDTVLVVHRVRNWSGARAPIFIKTQVNLWWQ